MKKLSFLFGLVIMFFISSCAKNDYACDAGDPNIVGATCTDGTSSSATGSGACSHHGGVSTWTCSN